MYHIQFGVVDASAEVKQMELLCHFWGKRFGKGVFDVIGSFRLVGIGNAAGKQNDMFFFKYIIISGEKGYAVKPSCVQTAAVNNCIVVI